MPVKILNHVCLNDKAVKKRILKELHTKKINMQSPNTKISYFLCFI